MIKRLALLLVIFYCSTAWAQTIKTDVLVIGGSPSGVAAAIQSARSKVKTVLVLPDSLPNLTMSRKKDITVTPMSVCTIEGSRNLPSGFWIEFRKRFLTFDQTEKKVRYQL